MEARELFKKLVKDAKERSQESLMGHGSQHPSDFEMPKGRFCHISDNFIDSLSDQGVEDKMVQFIYLCFRQR